MTYRYKLKPEQIEQITALEALRIDCPDVARAAIHIANERKTTPLNGFILQQMGVKKGVSDLFWPKPSNQYHGLFIEVKTNKGRPTPEQIKFIEEVTQDGYYGCFAYGAKDIIRHVYNYFGF
jgi:hypothetical protein